MGSRFQGLEVKGLRVRVDLNLGNLQNKGNFCAMLWDLGPLFHLPLGFGLGFSGFRTCALGKKGSRVLEGSNVCRAHCVIKIQVRAVSCT